MYHPLTEQSKIGATKKNSDGAPDNWHYFIIELLKILDFFQSYQAAWYAQRLALYQSQGVPVLHTIRSSLNISKQDWEHDIQQLGSSLPGLINILNKTHKKLTIMKKLDPLIIDKLLSKQIDASLRKLVPSLFNFTLTELSAIQQFTNTVFATKSFQTS